MGKNSQMKTLDERQYIRHQLYAGQESRLKKYARLVIGEYAFWKLFKYELITTLLGPLPGALGLFLRSRFYPSLFRHAGKGVVFGRNIVVRNPGRISLGDQVLIDDDVLLDGRGAGDEGVTIGDRVILNRRVSIQAKVGPIHIGKETDIGANSVIVSQGETRIDARVTLGGDCKIGGGLVRLDSPQDRAQSDERQPKFQRFSRGAVRIGSGSVLGRSAMVMDGVSIGRHCMVAAGAIVRENIPDDRAVMEQRKLVVLKQDQLEIASESAASSERPELGSDLAMQPAEVSTVSESDVEPSDTAASEASMHGLYCRVVEELNAFRDPDKQLPKARQAPLLEPEGPLDSMGMINLIVEMEQAVKQQLGHDVNLSDGTQEGTKSPFRTVDSFVQWVESLIAARV